MKQLTIMTVVMALLLWWLPATVAVGQQPAPIPTIRYQSQCAVTDAPTQADAYQAVLDFAPNTWTAKHTHAGPVCVSMLEGGITFRFDSSEKVLQPGESYLESSHEAHAAGNTTAVNSRMLVTNLTPKGGAQANTVQAIPNPVARTFNVKTEIANLPSQLDIVHLVMDFAPGAATPLHVHGGWALHTVLSGELTAQEKGTEKKWKPGDGWAESPGSVYAIGNSGSGSASLYLTILLPKGATLTTNQSASPATLPTSGGTNPDPIALWLLIGTAIVALVSGRLIWRKSRGR